MVQLRNSRKLLSKRSDQLKFFEDNILGGERMNKLAVLRITV